jgi:hypothetical protein
MPLPRQIPVRYSDEDAGYLSMRPVVKQTFQLHELADLVVSVVGKDPARVQQVFRTGSVIYNGYRYAWDPLIADLPEFKPLLAGFPDDDPARAFHATKAIAVLFEIGGGTQRNVVELTRKEASDRKFFAKASPWDLLLQLTVVNPPRYEKYSHARKGDLFRLTLTFEQAQQLLAALLEAAPRALRHRWSTLRPPAALTFVAPR